MPVRVDVTLKPSRMRWLAIALFTVTGALTTFLIWNNAWFALVWVLLPWLMHTSWLSEYSVNYLTFESDYFALWCNDGKKREFRWQGDGRISSLFLVFQLQNDEGERLTLVVWRDSLTDASWRAMNMAFRVAQPALLKQSVKLE
jgi:hypothetical protein